MKQLQGKLAGVTDQHTHTHIHSCVVEEVEVGTGQGLWGSGWSGRHPGVGPVDCLEWPPRSGSAAAPHKSNCGWRLPTCAAFHQRGALAPPTYPHKRDGSCYRPHLCGLIDESARWRPAKALRNGAQRRRRPIPGQREFGDVFGAN